MMAAAELLCYHCGEPAPLDAAYQLEIGGRPRTLCCPACLAVASLITGAGFENYYLHRQQLAARASEQGAGASTAWQALDQRPALWGQEVDRKTTNGIRDLLLQVSNIRCAACAWLIRSHIEKQPGIQGVQVDVHSGFCRIQWSPTDTRISRIAGHLIELGYEPHLPLPQEEEDGRRRERLESLKRLSVAGLGMMQVMMYAVGLYAGDAFGISQASRGFLSWVSLLVCLPVMLYSGRVFFEGAWRGIRRGRPGMDLPVALAIALAFLASAWNFFSGKGQVWFDSVVMFIFFLSLGRHVELVLRQRNLLTASAIARLLPEWAHRLDEAGQVQVVPATDLRRGDHVRVMAESAFPADGVLLQGQTEVDESLLSGESTPVPKTPGDRVIAGSINLQQGVELRVERDPQDCTVSSLGRLLMAAQMRRSDPEGEDSGLPRGLVPGFTLAVLAIALAAAWFWLEHDPARALPVALAVLVVSCPCALALALPVVRSSASLSLMGQGILLTRSAALFELRKIDTVVFDKTGTLTLGRPTLIRQELNPERSAVHDPIDLPTALGLAAAMEAHSGHALAQAFRSIAPNRAVQQVQSHAGKGLEAQWQGRTLRLGQRVFACPAGVSPDDSDQAIWLAEDSVGGRSWIARFEVSDSLRPGAGPVVAGLQAMGLDLHICSGDSEGAVRDCARRLAVSRYAYRRTPEDKISYIRKLQNEGKKILMIGDGVNDAPVMAAAQVSISVQGATELANSAADIILTGTSLEGVSRSFAASRKALRLARQNLAWALLYNLSVLPLAVSGALQPWMAALGMSASSLLVVLNATRMRSRPTHAPSLPGPAPAMATPG